MSTTVFTDGTNFTGAVGKYYDKKMIEQLIPKCVLYDAADKHPIPLNQGPTIHFYKIKEFATAMYKIAEGSPNSAEELSAKSVEATLIQRFSYFQISDVVDMTAINPVVNSAIDPISTRAAKSVDKEILWRLTGASAGKSIEGIDLYAAGDVCATLVHLCDVLDGNQGGLSTLYISCDGRQVATTFQKLISYLSAQAFANYQTDIANMGICARAIRAVVSQLWTNNAQPKDGSLFDGIAHPAIAARIMADEDFIRWNQFANADKGEKGILGDFAGVKWQVSPSMPLVASNSRYLCAWAGTASSIVFSAYLTLIYGTGCFAVSELTGKGGVKIIVKSPGPNDTSNPGDLYSTLAAKVTMAAAVLEGKKGYFLFSTCSGLA